jgi:cytochrome P450
MYRLCIHPEIQLKIRAEVKDVFSGIGARTAGIEKILDSNGWPTYQAVQKLKYLDAFCHEVIRLHPSVPKEGKFAKEDDILPDGTHVRKGSINIWTIINAVNLSLSYSILGDCITFSPWVMARTERFVLSRFTHHLC